MSGGSKFLAACSFSIELNSDGAGRCALHYINLLEIKKYEQMDDRGEDEPFFF